MDSINANHINAGLLSGSQLLAKDGNAVKRGKKKPFKNIMGEVEDEGLGSPEGLSSEKQAALGNDSSIEVALMEIRAKGEALKANPSMDNIRHYRTVVSLFMRKVVDGSIATEEHIGGRGFKSKKKYTILRTIDIKLESMAMGILKSQYDQLEILRRLDEINGLLIDLLQ